MKRYLALVPLAVFLIAAPGGCKDPYGASVKAGADIATGIGDAMKTVDTLRVSGLISVQEESNVLGYFKFANVADEAFLTCAKNVHTTPGVGSYTACAQTFTTTLANPQQLALIHVNNPDAAAQISTAVNSVTSGINLVVAALGGK